MASLWPVQGDLARADLDRQASTDHWESADRIEPALATEPTESRLATDPADPIDKIEPADPIDRIEPEEPILRIDPLEPILRSEPAEPSDRAEPCSMRAFWQLRHRMEDQHVSQANGGGHRRL
jgi:hypothetical protein